MELSETASILLHGTTHSLVLLDELGNTLVLFLTDPCNAFLSSKSEIHPLCHI